MATEPGDGRRDLEPLAERLRRFTGRPFGEFAQRELNPDYNQLGLAVVQEALEGLHYADLPAGMMVTVPMTGESFEPMYDTSVYSGLDFDDIQSASFEDSELARRVSAVLVVPIIKRDTRQPEQWRLTLPVLWVPDEDEWEQLASDYAGIASWAAQGRADELGAGADYPGEILHTHTNYTEGQPLQTYSDADGRQHEARSRGFYIRSRHTGLVLEEALEWLDVTDPTSGPPQPVSDEELGEISDRLAELDREVTARQRAEQDALRRRLIGDANSGSCDLCARSFPVELLVVAHIKPRAVCSDSERRDFDNVVMLACMFGCDALYERGYLSVDEEGHIRVSPREVGRSVSRYLELMDGRKCAAHDSSSSGYFRWHRSHVFRH